MGRGRGQAAEPSADFDDVVVEEVLEDPPDWLDAPLELPFDPLADSLEDPLDEPAEPAGAGTDAEELLRESVR